MLLSSNAPAADSPLFHSLRSLLVRGRHVEADQLAKRHGKVLSTQHRRAFLALRAEIALGLGRFATALDWAAEALKTIHLRDGLTCSLESSRIRGLMGLGRFREAKGALEQGLSSLEEGGAERSIFEAQIALHSGRLIEASQSARRACTAAETAGRRGPLAEALLIRARAGRERGDAREAKECLDRAQWVCGGLRDSSVLATVLSDRADFMAHTGDWDEAARNATRAGRVFARTLSPHEHVSAGRRTGLLGLAQGDPHVALPSIQKAADVARRGYGANECRAEIDLLLADAQLAGRDPEGALERATAALSFFRDAQDPGGLARAHVRRSLAALSVANLPLAFREAKIAGAMASAGPVAEGLADIALGRVFLRKERSRAVAPFTRAARNESLYPPLRFVARLGAALAEGVAPESHSVREAMAHIEAFGDRRIVSIVRSDLRELFGVEPPELSGAIVSAAACEPESAYETESEPLDLPEFLPGLIGASAPVRALGDLVRKAACCALPVSIYGETGTGKENVARAIHDLSPRASRKFVAFNAASHSDELFESELFGHVRGSFTGAQTDRAGLVEEAKGGTLFIDEVADLSPRAQIRLLRFLQDGKYRRVGENQERHADVRIVVAANQSLQSLVKAGRFREDLMYRLQVLALSVPPLRDRGRDILRLARHFVARSSGGRSRLSPDCASRISAYPWPGNVRELQLEMSRSVVFGDSPVIEWRPPAADQAPLRQRDAAEGGADPASWAGTLHEAMAGFERTFLKSALAVSRGPVEAARRLGISRQALHQKVLRYGL